MEHGIFTSWLFRLSDKIESETHYKLGNTSLEQGNLTAAIASYKKALKAKHNFPEAHSNLGNALMKKGNLNAAIVSYKTALKFKHDLPEIHHNLGAALQARGELNTAITSYETAITLKPNFTDAHHNLGIALMSQGELNAAIDSYKTAIKLNPNFADAHNNLGACLQKNGELEAAINCYRNALALKPNFPQAHNNLGNAYKEAGDKDAALTSYKTAIKLNPKYSDPHNNLGIMLQEQGDSSGAIAAYKTAIKLEQNNPDTHYNLGNALVKQGNPNKAISSYDAALRLNPNHSKANRNCAHAMFLVKNYKYGWEKYEWRSKTENPSLPHANPICPRLEDNGLSNIDKLLIVSEQGFGDTLHFMRYVLALQQRGIHTSLCAQPKLHSLIQASGIDASPLTPDQANQVTDGRWIPLLSLPMHLEVTPDNPIITEPYIHTSDDLFAKWQTILSAEQRPIIGINWQGSPTYEAKFKGRSLPLETFEPIATQTNAKLLSLQKGFGSDQLETCSFKQHFVNCQDQVNQIWDFHETAAIIANCDLIITSDTAVAHLAGGLGKSTWLLLQKIPEWRWGLEGDSTFWYPSMRLFRQSENDNWGEVIQQVTLALQEQFANNLLDS